MPSSKGSEKKVFWPAGFRIGAWSMLLTLFAASSPGQEPGAADYSPWDPGAYEAWDFDTLLLHGGQSIQGFIQPPLTPEGWVVQRVDPGESNPDKARHTRRLIVPASDVRQVAWSIQNRMDRLEAERQSGQMSPEEYFYHLERLADYAFRHREQRREYRELAHALIEQLLESGGHPGDFDLRLAFLHNEEAQALGAAGRAENALLAGELAFFHYSLHMERAPEDPRAAPLAEDMAGWAAALAAEAALETAEAAWPAEEEGEVSPSVGNGIETQIWTWYSEDISPNDRGRLADRLRPAHVLNTDDGRENFMLRLNYQPLSPPLPPDADKVIYRLDSTTGGKDATRDEGLSMTLYLPPNAADIQVAVAFNTGPENEWFESEPQTISAAGAWRPRRQTVRFREEAWKSAASGYLRFDSDVKNLDNIRSIFIIVYGAREEGSLYLDNIHFTR